jgi:hypothetical protein
MEVKMPSKNKHILNQSLEEIENDFWPDIDYPTSLVENVYKLRKKKLRDFNHADYRLAIGQNISADILVPLILDEIKADPLIDATFYPGDLLSAILQSNYWVNKEDEKKILKEYLLTKLDNIKESEEFDGQNKKLLRAIEGF